MESLYPHIVALEMSRERARIDELRENATIETNVDDIAGGLSRVIQVYTEDGNTDYADRVQRAGDQLIELAEKVLAQRDLDDPEKYRLELRIQTLIDGILNSARDGAQFIGSDKLDYLVSGGSQELPPELAVLFQGFWNRFRIANGIDREDLFDSLKFLRDQEIS